MTLERKLEKAASNKDVLEVIAALAKLSETAENSIDKLEKKVEALEKKVEAPEKDGEKLGFFSVGG